MVTLEKAVSSLSPNVMFSFDDNNIIEWDLKNTGAIEPTQSEIDGELVRMQAEYDAQEYARNREMDYPSIVELTVALYDTDDKAALETKRAAVKTKWPKDNTGPVED